MIANLADPDYSLELSSPVPTIGMVSAMYQYNPSHLINSNIASFSQFPTMSSNLNSHLLFHVGVIAIFPFQSFLFYLSFLFASMTFLMLQPRATLKFPLGEVSLEEKEEEELKRTLSVSGIVKSQLLKGVCTAQFSDEDLKLRYSYKVVSSWHNILS